MVVAWLRATGPTSSGHRRSSTILPSLAGRRGWWRPIAGTGAPTMSVALFTGRSRRATALAAIRAVAVTTKAPGHGPHLYISYRGQSGKATGYYVPKAAESEVRRGLGAWIQLQTQLRQLSALNKERALEAARVKK